jgi:hypothetical protein
MCCGRAANLEPDSGPYRYVLRQSRKTDSSRHCSCGLATAHSGKPMAFRVGTFFLEAMPRILCAEAEPPEFLEGQPVRRSLTAMCCGRAANLTHLGIALVAWPPHIAESLWLSGQGLFSLRLCLGSYARRRSLLSFWKRWKVRRSLTAMCCGRATNLESITAMCCGKAANLELYSGAFRTLLLRLCNAFVTYPIDAFLKV